MGQRGSLSRATRRIDCAAPAGSTPDPSGAGNALAKKKERVPWNALFGVGVAVLARRNPCARVPNPAPVLTRVNGVRILASGPAAPRPGLLTSGSHLRESFARISAMNVLSVSRTLPARHSFGVFRSPCDYR